DETLFPAAWRGDGPPWRLLRVASINPVKDHPTLLQAMRRVVDRLPEVHLDIVGEDTMNGTIQSLARTLDLLPHVGFHGSLPSARLARFYARAPLPAVSSRHEAAAAAVPDRAC